MEFLNIVSDGGADIRMDEWMCHFFVVYEIVLSVGHCSSRLVPEIWDCIQKNLKYIFDWQIVHRWPQFSMIFQQDANLLTNWDIFEFLRGELQHLKSEISRKLLPATNIRISESRHSIYKIFKIVY